MIGEGDGQVGRVKENWDIGFKEVLLLEDVPRQKLNSNQNLPT